MLSPPHAAPGQVTELPSYSGRPPPRARGTAHASRSSVAQPHGRSALAGLVSGSKGGTSCCLPGWGWEAGGSEPLPQGPQEAGDRLPCQDPSPSSGLCSHTHCGGPNGVETPCRPALGPQPQPQPGGLPSHPCLGPARSDGYVGGATDEVSGHAGRGPLSRLSPHQSRGVCGSFHTSFVTV